jgi:hypothetical protein
MRIDIGDALISHKKALKTTWKCVSHNLSVTNGAVRSAIRKFQNIEMRIARSKLEPVKLNAKSQWFH